MRDHGGGQPRPVGLDEHRLQVGHRRRPACGSSVACAPPPRDPGAHPPVAGEEVDAVPGAGGERGEQQRGVHRRVEPGHVVDPAGRRPRGVEHQQHPAVALGLPGAHHDVAAAGGGPPVDAAHVVAARRSRAASRTRCPGRAPAPRPGRRARAAGPAGWAGACASGRPAAPARVPGTSTRALPGRQPQRAEAADRHPVGAAGRRDGWGSRAGGQPHRSPAGRSSRCRLPVAPADGCQASRSSPRTRRRPGLATSDGRSRWCSPSRTWPTDRRVELQRSRAGREQQVDDRRAASTASSHQTAVLGGGPHQQRARCPAASDQRDATGQAIGASSRHGHRVERRSAGPAPTATPSSSASGRSPSRCARVAAGQRLHVVGRHEVAALQPRPGAGWCAAARSRRAG